MVTATPRGETATSVRETAGDSASNLYERDFYAWTRHNADLLRQGRLAEIDVANVAEELESMGRSERRELINRLAVLLAHLLKWRHQPNRRGRSWRLTIQEQRRRTARVLADNPSLQPQRAAVLAEAFGDAVLAAARETGFEEATFPAACPFTLEQLLDADFWPE